jgi:REP element-mobilizing transposase RayT
MGASGTADVVCPSDRDPAARASPPRLIPTQVALNGNLATSDCIVKLTIQLLLQENTEKSIDQTNVNDYQGAMAVQKTAAGRARKRRSEPEQLVLFKQRGGKRRGAGRPPKGTRAGSPHKERPYLNARYPVHVVLRTVAAVGNLRRRCVYQAIREATITTARRDDFRIIQLSIQRTHIHLLVEADQKRALSSGMQGFQISAAKQLNAAISKGRRGHAGEARCSPTAIMQRSSRHRARHDMPCPTS